MHLNPMHLWIVVMIILIGAAVLTSDYRHDVWVRLLIWFLIGWFVLGALLLGYKSEHL
jgi:nucleoside permease NupC